MKLTKRFADALGKVFEREIGAIPVHQSKAKVYRELEEQGLVRERTIHLGGHPPVSVTGWGLTPSGHMLYCQWAAENCEEVE